MDRNPDITPGQPPGSSPAPAEPAGDAGIGASQARDVFTGSAPFYHLATAQVPPDSESLPRIFQLESRRSGLSRDDHAIASVPSHSSTTVSITPQLGAGDYNNEAAPTLAAADASGHPPPFRQESRSSTYSDHYLASAAPTHDDAAASISPPEHAFSSSSKGSGDTAVPSAQASHRGDGIVATNHEDSVASSPTESLSRQLPGAIDDTADVEKQDSRFEPLKPAPSTDSEGQDPEKRPTLQSRAGTARTQEEMLRMLSRRRTNASGKSDAEVEEEHAEVERLMSRMFGQDRQKHSEDEKTRHVGVVFRDLTVFGMGLGAALQPTIGDVFLGLPRFLKTLLTRGPKAARSKPPVREILSHFSGCIRPGEMCLVLGRPGSGCSTFLKVLGNQRSGFEHIDGEVTYGGTDAKKMAKDFRGEVLYNPEDDLHYATLTVKDTLEFALRTRTPGKESRNEGESPKEYVREFLRVVTKLFWIEHTLGTKVGNEFVRGVSGGEKKRVSLGEALITKASVQAWDNSTRGLGKFLIP